MERADLEEMNRDSLIARAESCGVARARVLTKSELIDELLLHHGGDTHTGATGRGLFGRARDLMASLVERGLHLPNPGMHVAQVPPSEPLFVVQDDTVESMPTVSLAQIYAKQGYVDRAVATLEGVLERSPNNESARALLAQLHDESFIAPDKPLPPEEEVLLRPLGSSDLGGGNGDGGGAHGKGSKEPFGMLDDAPLPTKYDVDECVAIPVDPSTLFVYWEIRDSTFAAINEARPGGSIFLRVLIIVPTWDGPRSMVRDYEVGNRLGDWFARGLPPKAVVRAAIGWMTGTTFIPIAHSPSLEVPSMEPSATNADVLVRWTAKGPMPVSQGDADAISIERALARARVHAVRSPQLRLAETEAEGETSAMGSSDIHRRQ